MKIFFQQYREGVNYNLLNDVTTTSTISFSIYVSSCCRYKCFFIVTKYGKDSFIPFSFIFFVYLFKKQFVQLESLFTGIIDEFPDVLAKRRPLFIGLASLLSFAAGLALVSRGGIYWFTLFDTNAASGFSLLYLIFFQTVAISWFYGTDTFVKQIEFMLDKKVSVFWVICWKYVSPLLTMVKMLYK